MKDDWTVRIGAIPERVLRTVDEVVERAGGLFDNTIRLGVTGLSGAGKTVFITALVHNLLRPQRLPHLAAVAANRYEAAILRPQPDPDLPRFDYETHIGALQSDPPIWPESTRMISQLRVSIRYQPRGVLRRQFGGPQTLNIDIVDYPGEWLLDLPLLRLSYAEWCERIFALCRSGPRHDLSADWRGYVDSLDPLGPEDETVARRSAELYTAFLLTARKDQAQLSRLQPGRFLMPGDLAGSPALTFSPLIPPRHDRWARGTLWALMDRRFEAYKDVVVRPFFRDHFARLDRQVVLVDVLRTLNAGAASVADLRAGLKDLLELFRPGRNSWLWPILGRRVERVLFAATKADHVPVAQHDRLTRLIGDLLFDPMNRAGYLGADISTLAVASLRTTREAKAQRNGELLDCIEGIPVSGGEPVVVFPGLLPETMSSVADDGAGRYGFTEFRPPPELGRDGRGLPHIRLDRALQFLIGDRLE